MEEGEELLRQLERLEGVEEGEEPLCLIGQLEGVEEGEEHWYYHRGEVDRCRPVCCSLLGEVVVVYHSLPVGEKAVCHSLRAADLVASRNQPKEAGQGEELLFQQVVG